MRRFANLYRGLFHFSITLIVMIPWPVIFRLLEETDIPHFLLRYAVLLSLILPFYYVNVYLLVPLFLKKRKYTRYLLLIVLCVGLSLVLCVLFESIAILPILPARAIHIILPLLFLITFGTSFEMILSWEKQNRREDKAQMERISAELAFLKVQISPHLLFNSLNNIYSLAEKRSEKTSESVLLLSNIMRYVLYDANQGPISMKKEIEHLENYIAMQQLRTLGSRHSLYVDFYCHGELDEAVIEPLIIIPFVENAFKHGAVTSDHTPITIEVGVINEVLTLLVSNRKKQATATSDHSPGGIGLVNAKRRLDLIYGGQYELSIEENRERYSVHLTIKLNGRKMHELQSETVIMSQK